MTFKNAVASCLLQYANMRGRASRSEFWWFQLFIFAVSFVLYLASFLLPDRYYNFGPVLNSFFFIAMAIPLFSVCVRRMHDTGRSAFAAVLICVPVLNLLCLWWASRPGDARANAYGPAPDEGE